MSDVDFREVSKHYSRKATMKEDGWEGLTYTEDKDKACLVCVIVYTHYKPPNDSEFDDSDEKLFWIDTKQSREKANELANKYADKLCSKYDCDMEMKL